MKNSIVLELKFSTASEQLLSFYGDSLNPETEYIYQLINMIDEKVGGMLCFDHYCLPDSRSSYVDNRWSINIHCCCDKHAEQVENRLKLLFPSN